jgi:hypothetical protein
LEYDKTSASSLFMIGMAYQKKGEKEKGIALCDKAIEMDPNLAGNKQKKMMAGLYEEKVGEIPAFKNT